ncbi:MAG TPA: TolC family protein, partial [Polyangiaceae bacterium]
AAVALADAEKASPELAQLSTQIKLVQDQLQIAGDPLRPRLDLDAWVQVQGLGNREVPPAFEQAGRLEAVSAHVGLTFEAPLDGTRRRSQIASARLAKHIAEKQLEATRQRLRSDVLSAIASREAAETRVQVASETVRVAGSQAEAERRRFAAGISIALQVQEAENSLRQAQLRFERARVDWMISEIQLAYLRGRLLERYRSVLARIPPPPPNLDSLATSPL